MKRYFSIFFSAGMYGGNVAYSTPGHYPFRSALSDDIKKSIPKVKGEVVVKNIIELSKADYEDWQK